MIVENPLAYRFIFQDDVYLLDAEKAGFTPQARPAETPAPVAETPKTGYKYLGGHKKKFLILTHYTDAAFIEASHQAALESTLKRIGYTLDDVAIFNRAGYADEPFELITGFFEPQTLLMLGKSALPPGFTPPAFNAIGQTAGVRTLFTFGFDEMMSSNDNKKIFWDQVKQF